MAQKKPIVLDASLWRGIVSIAVFVFLWQIGSMSKVWIKWEAFEWLRHTLSAAGYRPIYVPWIGAVPAPTEVVQAWLSVLHGVGYWQSWYMSFLRVLAGFLAAMVIGKRRAPDSHGATTSICFLKKWRMRWRGKPSERQSPK